MTNATPEIAIVVPVFNEDGNVLPLADELVGAMQPLGRTYELVFVDDASTDATWEKIRAAQQRHPCVRVWDQLAASSAGVGITTMCPAPRRMRSSIVKSGAPWISANATYSASYDFAQPSERATSQARSYDPAGRS